LGTFAVVLGTSDAPSPRSSTEATAAGTTVSSGVTAAPAVANAVPLQPAETGERAISPVAPLNSLDRVRPAASRRLVLHLDSSTDVVVFSSAGGAMQDMRIDPATGTVEVRVGHHVLSIRASGMTGISFEH
jgi:hypothetical protein